MSVFDALRTLFAPPPIFDVDPGMPIGTVVNLGRSQERSLSFEQMWRTGSEESTNTIAGVRVSAETAMNAPAVWACVRLISGAIAGLPLHAYREQGDSRTEISLPEWIRHPVPYNPNITRAVHVQQVVTSLLLDGNAFIYVIGEPNSPRSLRVLDPSTVDIKTDGATETSYVVKGATRTLTPAEVVHIPYQAIPGKERGLNPIDAARESIGLSLAADLFGGSFFGNGATLSGVIEFPEGAEPTPEELTRLKEDFKKKHVGAKKSFSVGALTGGAKWNPNVSSNRDSQFLELREYQVEDIGRMYGVPPHMIGSQKPGAVAYASVEQRNIDFVTHGLQPVIEKLEDAYERVLRGQRTYFKFNVSGLLRGDVQSRWTAYGVALDKKVVLREEVRAWEDLPNIGELGFLETPNNNPPEEPAPADDSASDEMAAAVTALAIRAAEPERSRDDLPLVLRAISDIAARPGPSLIIQNGEEKEPVVVPPPDVRIDTEPFAAAVRELHDLVTEANRANSEAVAELRQQVARPRKTKVIRDETGKIVGAEQVLE